MHTLPPQGGVRDDRDSIDTTTGAIHMADSTPAGQDDAQARLNGLMGSLGKRTTERDSALARVAELQGLNETLQAQLQAQVTGGPPADSQPEQDAEVIWQSPDGRSTRVRLPDGTFASYDSGLPIGTNPARDRSGSGRDDGTPGWAKAQLAKALGATPDKTTWP